jgi:predicted short-subunit dehydrogenase-like oxidoreductase (DUF2520 family)
MPPKRPTIAIIGAGRVGRALGRLLQERHWRIGVVITRSQRTARAAVRAIGAGRPQSRFDPGVLDADLVLISTPDRVITSVAEALARLGAKRWAGKIVLHTSGALDRKALRGLDRLGAATGSLHPLQTFSATGAPPPLRDAICAIEGTPAALRVARLICRDLGCIPVVLAPKAKPAYHAAGAFAAGHVLAVIEAATRMLLALGFSRRDAIRALLPLTRQTLANFERLGPIAAWTGPLARGDFETVRRHAGALRRFPREYRDAYGALSRLALLVLARPGSASRRPLERALGIR